MDIGNSWHDGGTCAAGAAGASNLRHCSEPRGGYVPRPFRNMIIPNISKLSDAQFKEVTDIVASFGCKIQPIFGEVQSIYAIIGDERNDDMIIKLEGLPFVDRVDRIQSPHKLMDIRGSMASHRVKIGGITLGQSLFVCAGPCTIDPKNPVHREFPACSG